MALCPGADTGAVLQAFLHAAFNSRTLGRVFGALATQNAPLFRDWLYAWAPLRQPGSLDLTQALVKLDGAAISRIVLPVDSVLGDPPLPPLTRAQVWDSWWIILFVTVSACIPGDWSCSCPYCGYCNVLMLR
jgi:hypothetical protein